MTIIAYSHLLGIDPYRFSFGELRNAGHPQGETRPRRDTGNRHTEGEGESNPEPCASFSLFIPNHFMCCLLCHGKHNPEPHDTRKVSHDPHCLPTFVITHLVCDIRNTVGAFGFPSTASAARDNAYRLTTAASRGVNATPFFTKALKLNM